MSRESVHQRALGYRTLGLGSVVFCCSALIGACTPDPAKPNPQSSGGAMSTGGRSSHSGGQSPGQSGASSETAGESNVGEGGAGGAGGTTPGSSGGPTGAVSSTGGQGSLGGSAGRGGQDNRGGASAGGDVTEEPGGAGAGGDAGGGPSTETIVEEVEVDRVWSGHPVQFPLLTRGDRQFVAYYDGNRQMTFAMRKLGEKTWQKNQLPSVTNWDSHNWIRVALDSDDQIHVSGNMHNANLVYFRTRNPLDITSFSKYTSMVGTNENSMTYPEFFHNASGDLIYNYRNGGAGDGNTYFNQYSTQSQKWSRLYTLTDGEGLRNSYPVGPVLGPDGYWHIVWIWRDSADAETNHDVSYARSKDLLTWESAAGAPIALPIKLSTSDVVDPVPVNGGAINNNTKIGFDAENRVIISYHKFESPTGATQLYNARFEDGAWKVYQTTKRWGFRWAFQGQGTLVFPIEFEGVKALRDGTLIQRYYHAYETNVEGQVGWGCFRLNPKTLVAEELIEQQLPYPRELDAATTVSSAGILASRWASDSGSSPDPSIYYMARWETLDSNRDQERPAAPEPTPLKVYAFRYSK
ncbi:MAG TPA: BNR repeat-containing protein [Polyangiaceae bacterium]|nr:BNR repeat-containing protein [Polyangiaceae bacterium]